MQLGTLRRVSWRELLLEQLVPTRFRLGSAVIVAACVAVTIGLAPAVGHGLAGRLDSAFDQLIQTDMGRFPALLTWLPDFGQLRPVAFATLALALACVATRRWTGALLAVVAEPAAVGLTEYVLKPNIGGPYENFPSGHASSMFALATICAVLLADPPRRRVPRSVRVLLVLLALLLAAAVAAAMVATGAHDFADAAAGTAVGIGVVLACALGLDLVTARARRGPGARPASAG